MLINQQDAMSSLYLHYTPTPEKEKFLISWGSLTMSKVVAAPRKGEIFHLVGQFDHEQSCCSPPKRKNHPSRGAV